MCECVGRWVGGCVGHSARAYACTAEPKTSAIERNSPRDKRGVVGISRAHGGGWGGVARVMVGLWHTEQCGIECEIERRSGATAGRAASDGRGVPRGNCRGAGQLVGGVGGVRASSELGNRPRAHVVKGCGEDTLLLAPATAWRADTGLQGGGESGYQVW